MRGSDPGTRLAMFNIKPKRQNIIKILNYHPVPDGSFPKPGAESLPQWWRDMSPYGGYGGAPESNTAKIEFSSAGDYATIKRCIPVLDSMLMGYIVTTVSEIYVLPFEGDMSASAASCPQEEFVLNSTYPVRLSGLPQSDITWHEYGQALTHPLQQKYGQRMQKVYTPWLFMSPPGYSSIITNPLNNPNPYFEVVPGVMDTDVFFPKINFMLVYKDPTFHGIIPAGTPIAQVIPFKRESWSSYISDAEEDRDEMVEKRSKIFSKLSTVFHAPYRKFFWSKKEFK